MFRRHNTRPIVKNVNDLVNRKSHKQRKYLSLMLVPSYSSGKTRSLRIPRIVFHCILAAFLVVSAVIAGFYLRSERFIQRYQDTSEDLSNTLYRFELFQAETEEEHARFEEEQIRLMEESLYIYEQLTEEQRMFRMEQNRLRMEQQSALNDIQYHIDELERVIREFDEERQAMIEGLSHRHIIPPVAELLDLLDISQSHLLASSALFSNGLYSYEDATVMAVGFVSFVDDTSPANISEVELHERLNQLKAELELQMLLMEDFLAYRDLMDPHIRNFPTLWPITTQVSSEFGWRRNPMGGRGGEFHSGIDLRAPRGTSIRAAGGGTVSFVGWQGGYGNTVIINHGNGITTLYAHNTANLVTVGQRVERGDVIATVGTTGRTTGPHVHFEVRINDTAVNPRPYMMEHWSN